MDDPSASNPAGVLRPKVVTRDPLNVETPLSLLDGGVTPTAAFYIRSNFRAPSMDADSWRLRVHGAVEHPRVWTLQELQELGVVRCRTTLECAGNGRNQLRPQPPGTPWGLGAAGTAEFTGVALAEVLDAAGIRPGATTCIFSGADEGEVEDGSRRRFQRSLPLAEAIGVSRRSPRGRDVGDAEAATDEFLGDRPLLAWRMNGEPLTRNHGRPVRLVVPRWYAVASVKWLVEVELTERPFEGWFQTDRYMYRGQGEATPVRTMRVRSLITSHPDGSEVDVGPLRVAGVAWSGEAPVARVEMQVDAGEWTPATLHGESTAGVATGWEHDLELSAGSHTLRVRAVDEAGRGQPDRSAWNELGYGNHGIHGVTIRAG